MQLLKNNPELAISQEEEEEEVDDESDHLSDFIDDGSQSQEVVSQTCSWLQRSTFCYYQG